MKINHGNASDSVSVDSAYLDLDDTHVDLVTHAAAKALSELHRGSYEYKELADGWIGFRVCIDPSRVKVRVDDQHGPKIMVVSFEKEQFNFRGEEHFVDLESIGRQGAEKLTPSAHEDIVDTLIVKVAKEVKEVLGDIKQLREKIEALKAEAL
uniref:Uncharacterized protein n=1 Tax=Leptospirillum ferrodiazotrophum TaxID=412449 RepID=C6HTW1_9BACT|nr:MAG: hypothetical protein UBAL3_44810027 [Leptospirillum ferrodiazotrophum]